MGRLLVARHGRTAWNAARRFQGMGDPPLDEVGEEQAASLAAAFAPIRPFGVVSSDLRRARTTAARVAAACGLAVEVDPALREVDVGRWEGLTHEEVEERYPEEYRRWSAGEDIRRGGGETVAAAGARAAPALVRVAACTPPAAVSVVVAHGIVIQAALDSLASAGQVDAPDLSGGAPHLGNAQWVAVDLRPPPAERPARCLPPSGQTRSAGTARRPLEPRV